MLRGSRPVLYSPACRHYATHAPQQSVPTLHDASLTTFQQQAFEPSLPALLPRQQFNNLPAITKWFTTERLPPSPTTNEPSPLVPALNTNYFSRFGAVRVPLEITHEGRFTQIHTSLSFFLECVRASTSRFILDRPARRYFSAHVPGARRLRRTARANAFFSASAALTVPTAHVYLAQLPVSDLPRALQEDVPVPGVVRGAGKGDVYGSAVWLGLAPTETPLHRDPNPNLLVQLAGRKVVRLFRPEVGRGVFARVQERIGGRGSEAMRGEEMMQGEEKVELEREVWGESGGEEVWEATLEGGDGLFIPKGWWHSVKGVGKGMTGSVNWWFR